MEGELNYLSDSSDYSEQQTNVILINLLINAIRSHSKFSYKNKMVSMREEIYICLCLRI